MHEDYDLMNYGDGDNTPSSNFSEGEYLIHQHLGLVNWYMGYRSSIYMPTELKQEGGEKVIKTEENKDLFDELPYDADFVSARSCDEHDLISHVHIKKIGERHIPNFNPIEKLSCNVGDDPRDCYYGVFCPICGTLIRHRKANVVQYKESNWAYTGAEFVCQHCNTEFYTDPFIMPEHQCIESIHINDLCRGMFFDKIEDANPYLYKKETAPVFVKYCPAIFVILWILFVIAALVALGVNFITVILSWKQQIPLDEKFGICVIAMMAMVTYCVLYAAIENFIDRRYGKIYEVTEEWENRHE